MNKGGLVKISLQRGVDGLDHIQEHSAHRRGDLVLAGENRGPIVRKRSLSATPSARALARSRRANSGVCFRVSRGQRDLLRK